MPDAVPGSRMLANPANQALDKQLDAVESPVLLSWASGLTMSVRRPLLGKDGFGLFVLKLPPLCWMRRLTEERSTPLSRPCRLLLLFIVPLAFISCQGGFSGHETPVGRMTLCVADLTADSIRSKVWLDDELLHDSTGAPWFSARLELADGTHELTLAEAGTVPPRVFYDMIHDCSPNTACTWMVVGHGSTRQTLILPIETNADSGTARVRFVYAAVDGPMVNVFGQPIRELDDEIRFDSVAALQHTGYVSISPSRYAFSALLVGPDTAALATGDGWLSDRGVYSLYLARADFPESPSGFVLDLQQDNTATTDSTGESR
jgi:hypothetical protein